MMKPHSSVVDVAVRRRMSFEVLSINFKDS